MNMQPLSPEDIKNKKIISINYDLQTCIMEMNGIIKSRVNQLQNGNKIYIEASSFHKFRDEIVTDMIDSFEEFGWEIKRILKKNGDFYSLKSKNEDGNKKKSIR